MFVQLTSEGIAIFGFYKDLATSFNTFNQTNGCHKTKLRNQHLVLIGEENEI